MTRSLVLEVQDIQVDDQVQSKADKNNDSRDARDKFLKSCGGLPIANEETHCLTLCQKMNSQHDDIGTSVDPECYKESPEIIIECSKIFQPEDVDVPHDGNSI